MVMLKRSRTASFCLTGILLGALSCIGCSSVEPVTPDLPVFTEPVRVTDALANRLLWGLWDVGIDRNTGEFEVVPVRGASFHLNTVKFLEPPPLSDLTIDLGTIVIDQPANYVAVDVILTHPFPGLTQYTGFDVRGIVLVPGSVIPFSDPSLIFPGSGEPTLVNPDGWTRWWNPREFPGVGIFGFQEGLIGSKGGAGVFTSTVNGYKYFCDGLVADDPIEDVPPAGRGMFTAGSTNRRHYQLDFGHDAGDWLRFQYAVDACWDEPVTMVNPDVPGDFPMDANAPEGYSIQVEELENSLWWLDGIGMGGVLNLSIDVYTWWPEAVERVVFEAPGILNSPVEATVVYGSGGGPDDPVYSTYSVEIEPDALHDDGPMDTLITVETDMRYTQGGYSIFFGPPEARVSGYLRYITDVSFIPPLSWQLVTAGELPVQPSTVLNELSVVGRPGSEGVYFFGDEYRMYRYNLTYSNFPQHVTTLSGFVGYSQLELYGAPETLGRFELCPFRQFVASTISAAPSPTFLGGLKRDYGFFFNDYYSPTGQIPVQIGIPDPTKGFFRFVDCAANWANAVENAKIYWIQVNDPDSGYEPDESITVILGVYQHGFTGNPFSGDIDYLSGSLVPKGEGDGQVDIECVDRFAVDGEPQGVTGSTDLICWFLETDPPAIECFSVVSGDDSGDLNEPLVTLDAFYGTPRDMAVMPTHKGGYGAYNWLVVLEEGAGSWSIETFDQTGASWTGLYDLPGYPACMDIDPVRYQVHVWFSLDITGRIYAAVFDLDLG